MIFFLIFRHRVYESDAVGGWWADWESRFPFCMNLDNEGNMTVVDSTGNVVWLPT